MKKKNIGKLTVGNYSNNSCSTMRKYLILSDENMIGHMFRKIKNYLYNLHPKLIGMSMSAPCNI